MAHESQSAFYKYKTILAIVIALHSILFMEYTYPHASPSIKFIFAPVMVYGIVVVFMLLLERVTSRNQTQT
uniref:Uncharacterized protein n=1 Tax=viral metagenome TaxID=1070528 RepID=A0A6C0CMT3_9ZZZZ